MWRYDEERSRICESNKRAPWRTMRELVAGCDDVHTVIQHYFHQNPDAVAGGEEAFRKVMAGAVDCFMPWLYQQTIEHDGASRIAGFGLARFVAGWAAEGFARVDIRELRAATLAATCLTNEAMASLIPPWKTFMITLPSGFLEVHGIHGEPTSLAVIYVTSYEVVEGDEIFAQAEPGDFAWNWVACNGFGPERVSLARGSFLSRGWVDDLTESEEGSWDLESDDRDQRVQRLIGRLVGGVLLSLEDPAQREEARRSASSKANKKRLRPRGTPVGLVDFVLGGQVPIDARGVVAEYQSSGGNSPRVRSFTRGHWKSQAYGEGRRLRKRIHVDGYWRGAKGAPVRVRKHTLG